MTFVPQTMEDFLKDAMEKVHEAERGEPGNVASIEEDERQFVIDGVKLKKRMPPDRNIPPAPTST